jgi:hypothetical protein
MAALPLSESQLVAEIVPTHQQRLADLLKSATSRCLSVFAASLRRCGQQAKPELTMWRLCFALRR